MANGDPTEPEHPQALMLKTNCCPTHLQFNPASLSDNADPEARGTTLLLAGETFLASARDPRKPLELRAHLEKAGLKLIEEGATTVLRSRKAG